MSRLKESIRKVLESFTFTARQIPGKLVVSQKVALKCVEARKKENDCPSAAIRGKLLRTN